MSMNSRVIYNEIDYKRFYVEHIRMALRIFHKNKFCIRYFASFAFQALGRRHVTCDVIIRGAP